MAKLQLALDAITLEDSICLLAQVEKYVDIIEAGTPYIMQNGMQAVERIHAAFPALEILCDGKIMDAGTLETAELLDAGARYVTVLALTDDQTILDCVAEAERRNALVMADMICVRDIPARVAELENLGVHIIAVHTGVDQQKKGRTPLDDLATITRCVKRAKVAVAGGITLNTVDRYLACHPDIIIVGGGILGQPQPVVAAKAIYERIHQR